MITFRVAADVKEDRQVVLTLPPEVPIGKTELLVSVDIAEPNGEKPLRTSLADWAEANSEDWGDQISSEDVEGFTGRRF